jgi:hypothetical protein
MSGLVNANEVATGVVEHSEAAPVSRLGLHSKLDARSFEACDVGLDAVGFLLVVQEDAGDLPPG